MNFYCCGFIWNYANTAFTPNFVCSRMVLKVYILDYKTTRLRVPNGLMVLAAGFLIHCRKMTWVQTPVLELSWSELEVVVAGEGGHCVGRGPPVWCAQQHTPARLHLDDWTAEIWPKTHCGTGFTWRRSSLSPHLIVHMLVIVNRT